MDSWTPDQLKIMSFGGNNRALTFFKQHGWTDGGKIEAKYTSRAADLYRQILAKEVAKSAADDFTLLPSSPVASQAAQTSNGFSDFIVQEAPKENVVVKKETHELPASPKYQAVTATLKKPLGAKRNVKTGGLGARKLTSKVVSLFIV